MARDDSALNTGMSSAVERRRLQKQKELHDKKQQQQAATRVSLTRDGSAIMDWIDEEIKDVSDLASMTTEFNVESLLQRVPLAKTLNVTNAELLQAMTIAKLLHIEWLKSAKTKVNKYMKEPKAKTKKAESFGEEK